MRLILGIVSLVAFSLIFRLAIAAAAPTSVLADELEEPIELLLPAEPRSEQEQDQLHAVALFSTGRMLQQRHELTGALRLYQRALRYDPDAQPVLRELVSLAFSLGRPEDGLRYLVRYAEDNPLDRRLLERAADRLAEARDWPAALTLCEQLAGAMPADSPQAVLLQIELGRLYFLTGQISKSSAAFHRAMAALDETGKSGLDAATRRALVRDGTLYETMGAVFVEARALDDATAAFERLHKVQANEAVLGYHLARVAQAAGKPQQALDHLQAYLDSKVTDKQAAPYVLLAWALKELKQEETLLPRLEALRASQPDNVPLLSFLGKQHLTAGELGKAQELFEAAKVKQPSAEVYQSLVAVYRRDDQPEQLLKLLTEVIKKEYSLAVLDEQATLLANDREMVTKLVALAREKNDEQTAALQAAPRAVGMIAAEARRWDDAAALFELAAATEPKSADEVFLAWGLGLFLDQRYAESSKVFQQAIDSKARPADTPMFYFYLSGALELEGKTDQALEAAKRAAQMQPRNPRFASRAAWILYHAKRHDAAYLAYQEFVDAFDKASSDGAREALREARLALSNICVTRSDIAPAVEWLEQVLDEFPDDAGANNDLGYLWADQNQHLQRAHRMIQLAVAHEPDNTAYRDSLGWVLFRLGRFGESVLELEKAAVGDHPDGVVLDHLGDAYDKLGRTGDAQATWRRSIEAFKNDREEARMKAVEAKLSRQ